jgi:hypothetical protein
MSAFSGEAQIGVQITRATTVIDKRNLPPHQGKELEQWSWRKFRNEKWIVFLDCKNNKIKMRKVS